MSKAKKQKNANKHRALSAQQTIPYIAMHPDGICQLPGGLYTKTLEYEDINYAVASTEDQTAIISGWSACLNYFDSSLPFQLSFVNRRSRNANRYKVNIPAQEDAFNSIRGEYVEMLKGQIAKSNNGIERYKYITFGLPAEGVAEARPRLGRVEADVMGNLKRLGVQSCPLDGRDRLAVLHGQMHPGGREPFRFAWKDIPKTGMGTKDYIAPDSFDFRQSRTFRVGQMWGAASYLQIMASELSDKLLAEILELDAELTVTMHIQTVDQLKAIKTIKGKISDIGRMKVEEQKKAVRAGYDMEILPPDLITFSNDMKLERLGVTPPQDWNDVEQVRTAKKAEIGLACSAAIYAGIDVGGAHYSLTEHDQTELMAQFQTVKEGAEEVPYHADGELCRMYTAEEFTALTQAATAHVFYPRTYCNHLNAWITRAGIDEIPAIVYGVDLPADLAASMAALIEKAGGDA